MHIKPVPGRIPAATPAPQPRSSPGVQASAPSSGMFPSTPLSKESPDEKLRKCLELRNDEAFVREALDAGACIDVKDSLGCTLFMVALERRWYSLLPQILKESSVETFNAIVDKTIPNTSAAKHEYERSRLSPDNDSWVNEDHFKIANELTGAPIVPPQLQQGVEPTPEQQAQTQRAYADFDTVLFILIRLGGARYQELVKEVVPRLMLTNLTATQHGQTAWQRAYRKGWHEEADLIRDRMILLYADDNHIPTNACHKNARSEHTGLVTRTIVESTPLIGELAGLIREYESGVFETVDKAIQAINTFLQGHLEKTGRFEGPQQLFLDREGKVDSNAAARAIQDPASLLNQCLLEAQGL